MSTSQSTSGTFVVAQVHPAGFWKPSYLTRHDADGSRSFRRDQSEAIKYGTRAAAERVASKMRETWRNEAGWYLEVREVAA